MEKRYRVYGEIKGEAGLETDRLLFLSPRIPYPLDTGGKIRTYHILRLLSQNHRVDVLSFFFSEQDKVAAKKLEERLDIRCYGVSRGENFFSIIANALLRDHPISYQRYISSDFVSLFTRLLKDNRYPIIHCDHLHMGQYVEILREASPHSYVRLDEHNVEYVIADRASRRDPSLFRRLLLMREKTLIKALERDVCRKVDEVWVVSEEDRTILLEEFGVDAIVVPNGVDLEFFEYRPYTGEEKGIVFIGSMDWFPNEDAVLYFVKEIWPLVSRRIPEISLYIVGRNPSSRILALSGDKVVVTGSVADVRPYLYDSILSIVPLRIGGGSRLKILESMSAGRVVVSTSLGAEGIGYNNGSNILIEDSPSGFAGAIERLYHDIELRKEIAESARRLVEERYSWRLPSV